MMSTANITPDQLRERILQIKKKMPENKDYIPAYSEYYGELTIAEKNKIRSIWNMRMTDEQITKNLEKLVQHIISA